MTRSRHAADSSPQRNVWRFFPYFVVLGLTVVVAVNFGMIYTALHTHPGNAGGDGFDLSNNYNLVLARVEEQAALGWVTSAEIDSAGRPVVQIRDRSGTALAGAGIQGAAERPVGAPHTTGVKFTEVAPGRYVGDETLDEKGQWDLQISAVAVGHRLSTTRRLVVR